MSWKLKLNEKVQLVISHLKNNWNNLLIEQHSKIR
jgi:hypothetical protein